jgi:hypothetical protein
LASKYLDDNTFTNKVIYHCQHTWYIYIYYFFFFYIYICTHITNSIIFFLDMVWSI